MWITRKKHLCIVQELKQEIACLQFKNEGLKESLKTAKELYDYVSEQNSDLRNAPLHKIVLERVMYFWKDLNLF